MVVGRTPRRAREAVIGKTVIAIVGVIAVVAISIYAPELGAALATTIFGATASATAIAITTAVVTLALTATLAVGMTALTGGAPVQRSPVGPPQVYRQSISDSFIVYGKRRVGGLMVFFHPSVVGDDHFRYFVVACVGHRCKGVVQYLLGDETVTVNPTTHMVTSGKYANAAWLEFERGNGATLCDMHHVFVSECGGQWTDNHIGTNTAKLFAKFQMTDAVVQAGLPNMTVEIEGKDDVLDPRDSTAKYTRNGPLCYYDWMKLPREEGGFGAYADEIPDATFISAQANVADEVVNGAMRYAIDAFIVTGSTPSEIRDVLTVNMAGSYTYSGGKHLMRPGYWVPVSQTLLEDDLAGAIQVSPFMASDRAANQVSGTYVDALGGYQAKPFATQSVASADVRQLDLDLAYTTNPDQAARIARIMLNRAQKEKTVLWPMNIVGLGVTTLDTVQVDSARYSLSNYAFQVTSWALAPDYGALLSLREESADIYDPPTVVAPGTPATITKADPLLTVAEVTALIAGSRTSGLTFSVASTGAVTVSTHSRIYDDKTVTVNGSVALAPAGAVAGDKVAVFYDQSSRAGGAVSYQSLRLPGGSGSMAGAEPSTATPYRHFVCVGTVPASGSTSGGSDVGSGGGAGGGFYGGGAIP